MSNSVFIARLIGPVMLVIGLAVFAMIIMPAGLAIVLTHNIWAVDGRVMITMFGWANLIGGAIRLAAPAYVMQTGRAMLKRPYFIPIAAAVWVVAGALFCLFGFRH